MSKTISLVVRPSGELQCLYNEELDLSALGPKINTQRASHVEPTHELSDKAFEKIARQWGYTGYAGKPYVNFLYPTAWWADLTPSNGSVLGPFAKRSQALEAEAEWIHENVLKAKR